VTLLAPENDLDIHQRFSLAHAAIKDRKSGNDTTIAEYARQLVDAEKAFTIAREIYRVYSTAYFNKNDNGK
jgi:hypothetical protein